MILFLVCPTYLFWHQAIYSIFALASTLGNCIVGFVVGQVVYSPSLGDFFAIFAGIGSITTLVGSGSRLDSFCPN